MNNNIFFLRGGLHRDLLLAVADASVQDALVGDKAGAEVELQEGADEETDDIVCQVNTDVDVDITVGAGVHSRDDNLNDEENGPDDGTDDKHSDEAVDPHWLLLVDTNETVTRHNSHQDVHDSDNNSNNAISTY